MTVKEIIASKYKAVKALFDAPVVPAANPAPTTTAVTLASYKLKDGTEISISGETIEIGGMVTIGGAQAPSGDYELEDGRTITVDAEGKVTLIVTPEPITTDLNAQPAITLEERTKKLEESIAAIEKRVSPSAMAAATEGNFTLTVKEIEAMFAKFATGTPEERLANLEIMVKAMMEYNFGYKIREGQENEAILAYKNSLAPVQTGLAAAEQKITKQDETIKLMLELVEKLVEEPTADPKTLTANQKEKFERTNAKDQRLKKFAEGLKERKVLN